MYTIRHTRQKTLAQSLVIRKEGRSPTLNVECNNKQCTCNLKHQVILKSRLTRDNTGRVNHHTDSHKFSVAFLGRVKRFVKKIIPWARTSISMRSVGKTSPPNSVQWKEHINVHQSVQTI